MGMGRGDGTRALESPSRTAVAGALEEPEKSVEA